MNVQTQKGNSHIVLNICIYVTEDTSPENLRKFLESDDPAIVMMGLSMAKGSGVPEKLLPSILRLYMWDEDKTIRAEAKSVFNKYAPKNIQAKIKENWKPSYRTLSIKLKLDFRDKEPDKFQKIISNLLKIFKSHDGLAQAVLYKLIRSTKEPQGTRVDRYGDSDKALLQGYAVQRLQYLDDIRAIRPLIRLLNINEKRIEKALANIRNRSITDPLIKMIRKKKYNSFQGQAAEWDAQMALPSYLHKRGAFPPHLPADADWKYPKKNFRKKFDWEYQDYLE